MKPSSPSSTVRLTDPAWEPEVRDALQQLIAEHAGSGQAVVFDFDNTLVRGDVTEAAQAWMVKNGRLKLRKVPAESCPEFVNSAGRRIDPARIGNAAGYYEELLDFTTHGAADPHPCGTGYMWAVEALAGMRLSAVLEATKAVYEAGLADPSHLLRAGPGGRLYPVPVFRPEMVELVACLIGHGLVPWVVSASNVWSVRWMVTHALNPLLRARGVEPGVAAERVIGLTVLLRDKRKRHYKDAVLVRADAAYAAMEPEAVKPYRLTTRLQLPVPVYSGKVAAVWDALGGRPLLAAGDSPGDHAMLAFARHRLWIDRGQAPAVRDATAELMRKTGGESWLVHRG
jgi:phosphoserine phosphatase